MAREAKRVVFLMTRKDLNRLRMLEKYGVLDESEADEIEYLRHKRAKSKKHDREPGKIKIKIKMRQK